MKMVEIKLRALTNEMSKLIKRKERIEKKVEKVTAKAEKLDCKWSKSEHSEWLANAPKDGMYLANKEDITKNGAWFDWVCATHELEDINRCIENCKTRSEKAIAKVDAYRAEVAKIEDAKKREELKKLEFEQEQKEWAKDNIKLENRYYGKTPNGKSFMIYGNCGWTDRSRHCFTLNIDGQTIFTSGEFWRCYMTIKNS